MCRKIDCFITACSQLRTDVNKKRWSSATTHRDPHKPVFLLAVFDLVARKMITKEFVEPTPELEEKFNVFWQKISPPVSNGSMARAFYHMKNERFWTLVPRPGVKQIQEDIEYTGDQIRKFYLGARLDKELFPLLLMESHRRKLQEAVLQTYFDSETQTVLL